MANPVVLAPLISGFPLSASDQNNNWALVENAFTDVAPYVVSGLTISAGTGLSVNVASGVAVIGAEITKTGFVIGSLTPSTTVHLYLNQDGTGSFNTSGTQPAKSVKLGTTVTSGSAVTSVAMGRTSGRQQFVQPQNLIPGGPAAGTTSAGHPDALNLANWNATDIEGKSSYGTLPDGAHSANVALLNAANVFTNASGNTFQISDAGTTNEPIPLTIQHRTSGAPGAAFGNTVAIRADNASNALADQLIIATGWSTATAGSENSLAILSIRRGGATIEVARLDSNGNGELRASADFRHTGAGLAFFNAATTIQQANSSQADITAVTDTHAKAALQAIHNLLFAYGLAPNTA